MSELTEVGTTSRGYTIYREINELGANRYWSDEIGGGVMVWDTCLVAPESLLLALIIENDLPCSPLTQRDLIYRIAGRKGTPK